MTEPWLTAPQAAQILGIHVKTLYRWARERRIPHCRMGRTVRFTSEQLDEVRAAYAIEPAIEVDVTAPNPRYRRSVVVVPMRRAGVA